MPFVLARKKHIKYLCISAAAILHCFCVYSQAVYRAHDAARKSKTLIKFAIQDMTKRAGLLFTVDSNLPNASFSTLFSANISSPSPLQPLTCYPESMELLSDGRFRVRSSYGAAIYDTNTSLLHYDAIPDIPTKTMRLEAVSQSPDGKWTCFVKRHSALNASLVLRNTSSGKEYVLLDKYDATHKDIPIKWSPDGSVFIYSKEGKIYFCDATALALGVQIDDNYRTIGSGTMQSVNWAAPSSAYLSASSELWSKPSNLFHIEGDEISAISQNSLYTQSIYAAIIGHGKPCGRLPYKFDPKRDVFSVRGDGKAIAVLKGGSLLSVYNIKAGAPLLKAASTVQISSPSSPLINAVILWGASGDALVWSILMPWGASETLSVHRVSCKEADGANQDALHKASNAQSALLMKEAGNFKEPVISPNGRRVAFFDDKSLRVCDTDTWQVLGIYKAQKVISAAWDGNYAMYLGGESTVSRWIVGDRATEALFPSAAINGKYQDGAIIAVCPNGDAFAATVYSQTNDIHWEKFPSQKPMPNTEQVPIQKGRYRVFCAPSPNPLFENAIYIRDLLGNDGISPDTRTICASCGAKRAVRRKIALVLDAYKNADNLAPALHALKITGVKASVFINGEFITRYPKETQSIAMSGATCASMFFADIDLAGGSFIPDYEFIARGLARNEDEFLRVTGRELLPLWHAPRYKADESVLKAGELSGYTYLDAVGEDMIASKSAGAGNAPIAPESGVLRTIENMLSLLEISGANALYVNVGTPLCLDMDVLIEALQDAGYEIVGAEEL